MGDHHSFNSKNSSQDVYLTKVAIKTGELTEFKLPDYCVEILKRYKGKYGTILPTMSDVKLNKYLKELGAFCEWNEPVTKIRYRRGKKVVMKGNNGENLKFSDLLTTHCMRRTAITTSLIIGIPEYSVRRLSGHSPNSKEFYRYVKQAQDVFDDHTSLLNSMSVPR